jgi:hypothetical protein
MGLINDFLGLFGARIERVPRFVNKARVCTSRKASRRLGKPTPTNSLVTSCLMAHQRRPRGAD